MVHCRARAVLSPAQRATMQSGEESALGLGDGLSSDGGLIATHRFTPVPLHRRHSYSPPSRSLTLPLPSHRLQCSYSMSCPQCLHVWTNAAIGSLGVCLQFIAPGSFAPTVERHAKAGAALRGTHSGSLALRRHVGVRRSRQWSIPTSRRGRGCGFGRRGLAC